MVLDDNVTLQPIDNNGYNWLGFWLCNSYDVSDMIKFHLSKKMFHVSSFYSWLDINRSTPIKIKLIVLYSCLFATILYSCEAWFNIDHLEEKLRLMEKKALKSCLGVKSSTPDDVIFQEVKRADIIAVIRDRQYNFFCKFKLLEKMLLLQNASGIDITCM